MLNDTISPAGEVVNGGEAPPAVPNMGGCDKVGESGRNKSVDGDFDE
jgi:hypothetical protein